MPSDTRGCESAYRVPAWPYHRRTHGSREAKGDKPRVLRMCYRDMVLKAFLLSSEHTAWSGWSCRWVLTEWARSSQLAGAKASWTGQGLSGAAEGWRVAVK
eukprot:6176409-Pleurochrysis_carterae.AAC.2